jgi:flagellar M-ring protein FliF
MLKSFATAASAQRELQQLPQEAGGGPPQLQSFEQNVDRAKQIARQDPKAVANVVKEWVDKNGK